jgi:hypothetical protein
VIDRMGRRAGCLAILALCACTSRNIGYVEDGGGGGDLGAADLFSFDFSGVNCYGLTEGACQAANCAADYCFNCSCTPSFRGCRPPNAKPYECPALGCPSPLCCRDQKDCGLNGLFCTAPDRDVPQCGICMPAPKPCTEDKHCANSGIPNAICGRAACVCDPTCVPGCALTADCREGELCDPNHHCRVRTCAEGCTVNFECLPGAKSCSRKPCKSDGDCPQKMCVLGFCHNGLGTCEGPPPP